jgi:putative addiction module component (TIGR02574 family)
MTKLQTIEAEIQALSADEQRELISKFMHVVTPAEDDFFELTDAEMTELDRRMLNLENKPTYTTEEVFARLREIC